MPKDTTEIILAIGGIDNLDELKRVDRAVGDRFRWLSERVAHERAAAVRAGDRIELSNISPKYLNGITGVVTTMPGGNRVEIRVEHPELIINNRYVREDGTMIVHAGAIVIIAKADEEGGSEPSDG
jgi:hypothetical protein